MGKAMQDIFMKRLLAFGVKDVPMTGLTEAAKKGTHRITGTVTSKDKNFMKVESILTGSKFAIGLTMDKAELKTTLEKLLGKTIKVPDFFADLVDTKVNENYWHQNQCIGFAI